MNLPDSQRRAVALAKNDYRLLFDLQRLRVAQGLSQKDVAKLLGITQQAVSKFENLDSDPRLSTIRQYAHAIGALVAHTVDQDTGQLEVGTEWRAIALNLNPETFETLASEAATYLAQTPRGVLFDLAA